MKQFNLIDTHRNVPVIEFALDDGATRYAIVDTGSEVSIFNNNGISDLDEGMEVVGFSGKAAFTKAPQGITLTMKDSGGNSVNFIAEACLSDMSNLANYFSNNQEDSIKIDAIFGMDFLKYNGAVIDLENNILTIND